MANEEWKEVSAEEAAAQEETAAAESTEETVQEVRESSEEAWEDEPVSEEGEIAEETEATAKTDAAAETEETEETEEADMKKGGFFRKKDKKDKKDEQIEALTDQLLRSRAEFDNYRKRTEKEMEVKFDLGAKNVVEKILPVVDNFERGLAAIPEGEQNSAVSEGMEKIYRQLTKVLEDMGVTPIEAVGKPFDPAFHNAVMQVPVEEGMEENTVVEELQKGYSYKGFVVRYSMVKVAI